MCFRKIYVHSFCYCNSTIQVVALILIHSYFRFNLISSANGVFTVAGIWAQLYKDSPLYFAVWQAANVEINHPPVKKSDHQKHIKFSRNALTEKCSITSGELCLCNQHPDDTSTICENKMNTKRFTMKPFYARIYMHTL